jgi:hypothetical protein
MLVSVGDCKSAVNSTRGGLPVLGMLPSFVSEFACFWLFGKFQWRDKAASANVGSPPDFVAVYLRAEAPNEEKEDASTRP